MTSTASFTRRQLMQWAAVGCVCGGAHRVAEARILEYKLTATEIASGTWAVYGSPEYFDQVNGGNIVNVAFIEVPDGIVVIDSGPSKRYAEELKALINATVPNKPILRVYNTHHHPDHVLGNQAFDPSIIAAPPGVIQNISAQGDALADNMYRLLGDWMRGTEPVVPAVSLQGEQEELGGRVFSLHYLAGHTSSDLVIRDEHTGVLFGGDLAFLYRAPTTPHAQIDTWHDSLNALQQLDKELILPGHGPVDAIGESLTQTAEYLSWLNGTLKDAVTAGLTMNEAMALPIPAVYQSLNVVRSEFERSVVHLYGPLENALLPRLDVER